MPKPKSHSLTWIAVLLSLASCRYTEADDPKDGPCGKRCEGELGYCHLELKTCVACTEDAHCTDEGAPFCDEATGRCGACGSHTDCPFADKARCNTETLVCDYPCQEHGDCEGLAGTEACSPDGVCVECTADNEAACDGKICEPGGDTCSENIEQDSAENCQSCVADSQCKDEHKCVPMQYQDATHGSYCLKLRGPGCAEPFRIELDRTSLNSSQAETFCGINEDLTTCEALLAFNSECDEDGKCIIDDVEVQVPGALCRAIAVPNRCTYYCSNATQCSPDIACANSSDPIVDDNYCGK